LQRIDCYAHIQPKGYISELKRLCPYITQTVSKSTGLVSTTDSRTGELLGGFVDIEIPTRINQMDKVGIERQVLSLTHPEVNTRALNVPKDVRVKLARAFNDEVSKIAHDNEGRFIPVAEVPLVVPDEAVTELERAVNDLGMMAVQLSSTIDGKPFDLPEFRPFFKKVESLGIPILIHPTFPPKEMLRSYEKQYEISQMLGWDYEISLSLVRIVFSGMLQEMPKLKIMSHHAGAMVSFFAQRIEGFGSRLNRSGESKLSKSPLEYFKMMYYDTAIYYNTPALRCAIDVFGIDNIVYATDYPLGPKRDLDALEARMRSTEKSVEALNLPGEELEKIYRKNPIQLFGIR
jgi:predicted TIM-barrel fold metal-dependent hydrolase